MISLQIIPSRRKTIALQVTPRGQVLVRCPLGMSRRQAEEFFLAHQDWVEAQLKKLPPMQPGLTRQELEQLTRDAAGEFHRLVQALAPVVGVSWGKITIRHQKSRWGSCSAGGNLSFNCLLMLAPATVREYVVVHELCHRRQMNHSRQFWAEVERVLPDYRSRRQWLKQQGGALLARLPEKSKT